MQQISVVCEDMVELCSFAQNAASRLPWEQRDRRSYKVNMKKGVREELEKEMDFNDFKS